MGTNETEYFCQELMATENSNDDVNNNSCPSSTDRLTKIKFRLFNTTPKIIGFIFCLLIFFSLIILFFGFITPENAHPVSKIKPVSNAEVKQLKIVKTHIFRAEVIRNQKNTIPFFQNENNSVVTFSYLHPNQKIRYCQPYIEISGRPIFAFVGNFQPYRDIKLGDRGRDIQQLQTALNKCGINIKVNGKADRQLRLAIERLYQKYNYPFSGFRSKDSEHSSQMVIPAGEQAYFPEDSIITYLPKLGAFLDGKSHTDTASGKPQAKVTLDAKQLVQLQPGMIVELSAGDWHQKTLLNSLPATPEVADEKTDNNQNADQSDNVGDKNYSLYFDLSTIPASEEVQCRIMNDSDQVYPKVIPTSALYYQNNQTVVYLFDKTRVEAGEKPKTVPVTVVKEGDGLVAIAGPVKVGDLVITNEK